MNDQSSVNFVAHNSIHLAENLNYVSELEADAVIINHIKDTWAQVPAVDDFKKNMDWFNVSEPLSLAQHCSDKIVILDFWTYCCINCTHVLADLAHIEKIYKVSSGVVVIGVHCAKFLSEKDSTNVRAAVERLSIQHPVVNDKDNTMWDEFGINCWPTLLVLGPGNRPLFIFTGEGHREELLQYIRVTLKHFGSKIGTGSLPISISQHIKSEDQQLLRFPSKIALNPYYRGQTEEPFIAISDSGNHRIILADCSGTALKIIGGPEPGFKDGELGEATFSNPQGVCWLGKATLAVCDAGNHAVRVLCLDDGRVELLAGNGRQACSGDMGGEVMGAQSLTSPWDIVLYRTADMDMTVRPPHLPMPINGERQMISHDENSNEKAKKEEKRRILLVACAGSHQIWAIFLDTTIWWKFRKYNEGTCVCIAGSGVEAARNSSYPHTAAFAQPSGLTLRTGPTPELFIADAESSTIRRLSLTTGQVTTVCGGDRDPLNLFAYGDIDDIGFEAKFQHPLDVAYSKNDKALYVADTYNNKIKKIDITTQKVITINIGQAESDEPARFNEPAGLALTMDGKYLYVSDTNNHCIKIINTSKLTAQLFKVVCPNNNETLDFEPENTILYKNDLFVNKKLGSLIIVFNVNLDPVAKVTFTAGAPQNWHLSIRDNDNKDVTLEDFELINCARKGNRMPGRLEMRLKKVTDKTHYRLYLSFYTALCDSSICFTHMFTIRSTILVRESVKMLESYKITCKINPCNKPSDKKAKR